MKIFQKLTVLLLLALTFHLQAAPNDVAKFSGTVVDEQGKPVAGVSVDCYHFPTRTGVGLPDLQSRQHTATDGKGAFQFSVPSGAVTVVVKKAGHASGWKTWESTPKGTIDPLVLAGATSFAGTVVDENDQPIADAEVSVSAAVDRKEGEWTTPPNFLFGKAASDLFSTRTTADGHFRIADFPAGAQANLMVKFPGRALRAPTAVKNGMQMEAQSGQDDLKLVTEPAASVEGKVVIRDTGAPLANVNIQVQPINAGGGFSTSSQSARSAADGTFRVPEIAAGSYRVLAVLTNQPIPLWVAETVPVTVAAGETARNVKIQAFKGGVVEVVVVGKNDQKVVPDVNVSAYSEGYPASGTTGNDGVARFRLPPGEFTMYAVRQGRSPAQAQATVADGATNRVRLELDVPSRITGIVRDSSGAPVPGTAVSVCPNFGSEGQEAKTDADGHYEVSWQKPAWAGSQNQTFFLLARNAERKLAGLSEIDETAASSDLELKPGVSISGRVQDANGKAIAGAMGYVVIQRANTGFAISRQGIRSDAEGVMFANTLPPGEHYSVSVSAKGYGSGQLSMRETKGDHYEAPLLKLKVADRALAGRVLNADGQPAAGIQVWMQGPGQPSGNATTDANGRFAFDAVCEGRITVSANSRAGLNGSFDGTGGDTNVIIRLGANNYANNSQASLTVSGTVYDPSGKPAPRVRVSVTPAWGPENGVTSGTNGEFTLQWKNMPGMNRAKYFVVARDTGRNLVGLEEINEKKTQAAPRLEPGFSIMGTVQDVDGNPLNQARVNLIMMAGGMGALLFHEPVKVESDGTFTIPALPKGQQYTVNVSAEEHGSFGKGVTKEQSQTNSIQLSPMKLKTADRRLAGQVIAANGKPASGARVYTYGNNQPNINAETDEAGHFDFKVCDGSINVNAYLPSDGRNVNVQARGGDANVVIKLGATPQQRQRQQRPAITPLTLKPQPWTLSAVLAWSSAHKATAVVLLGLQTAALLGAAGAALFFWMAKKRKP
jgi:protocatechuate 3,4-dioxygenase beta subunit